jgi:hypothetical protein
MGKWLAIFSKPPGKQILVCRPAFVDASVGAKAILVPIQETKYHCGLFSANGD